MARPSVAKAIVSQNHIDSHVAHAALAAGIAVAQDMAQKVNIAIVDGSGVLLSFVRMQGAPLHSIDIAMDKAYTAVSFGLATWEWAQAFSSHSVAVQQGLLQRPRFVAFGGGIPIHLNGAVLGAAGVSGASEEQDHQIALAVIAALPL